MESSLSSTRARAKRPKAVHAAAVRLRGAEERSISKQSVTAHALATFGSPQKAKHWMNRPNPLFKGKTPLQVIGIDLAAIDAELGRIDHGVYV